MKAHSRDSSTQLLIDGMLGSLARKLRILGFDALYDSKSVDMQLLDTAKKTNRWLVTSDVDLYLLSKRKRAKTILVRSKLERERLFQVLSKIGIKQVTEIRVPRCSACNGVLVNSQRIKNDTPIFSCSECGKDYWKGSHWKKLSKLFDEVNQLLLQRNQQ